MHESLNYIESTILLKCVHLYPNMHFHIDFVEVLSREYTGVGMYVNFKYTKNVSIPITNDKHNSLSTNEVIEIPELKNGLIFELCLTNGRIHFLEFVTIGECWTGNFVDAIFTEM